MALHLATANDYVQRNTPPPAPGGPRTWACWFRLPTVSAGRYYPFYALVDDLIAFANYDELWVDPSPDIYIPQISEPVMYAQTQVSPSLAGVRGVSPLASNVWVYLAKTLDTSAGAGEHRTWVNALPFGQRLETDAGDAGLGTSYIFDLSAAPLLLEVLGGDSFSDIGLDDGLDVAYFRSWDAALSQIELYAEMRSPVPVRTDDLSSDTPLLTDLFDLSGNGRDWTQVGAGTFISDAPPLLPSAVGGLPDQTLFSMIQRKLAEPANGGQVFFSEHWTAEELLRAAQDRQDAFLKATHLQIGVSNLDEVADQEAYDLPDDWIATVALVRFPDGERAYQVDLADTWDADQGDRTWQQASGRPRTCRDVEIDGIKQIVEMPAPATPTSLLLYYVPRGALLNGRGELLTLPSEMSVPVLQWGILADLLGKVGRGADLPRAKYCQMRWQLGIEVTALLLDGLA